MNLENSLNNKENFILIVNNDNEITGKMNKILLEQNSNIVTFEMSKEDNLSNFGTYHKEYEIKPDYFVNNIENKIKEGNDTILFSALSKGKIESNNFLVESLKESVLASIKSGARSIVVVEMYNKDEKTSEPVILPFKNEKEFLEQLQNFVELSTTNNITNKVNAIRDKVVSSSISNVKPK